MNAASSYDKFQQAVAKEAASVKRPQEISQSALWAKTIGVKAFAGKRDDLYTFRAGDKFGFSEGLVNQLIEYAMRRGNEGATPDEENRAAYERGYEAARREFAKATGLYTEDDLND